MQHDVSVVLNYVTVILLLSFIEKIPLATVFLNQPSLSAGQAVNL